MNIYCDTSVLVALFTDDSFSKQADLLFRGQAFVAVVSDFGSAEFASAISRHVRMRELTLEEARESFADFDTWVANTAKTVETISADIRFAETILRRLDLSLRTPDALNIAIAQRIGAELATFDSRMAENAKALGVALAPV